MSTADDAQRKRRSFKLNMLSKSIHRLPPTRLPERFKDGEDAQDDVTAPPQVSGGVNRQMQYMHHSIFSMITAVGSRSDFHARNDDSSDSDEDDKGESSLKPSGQGAHRTEDARHTHTTESRGKVKESSGDAKERGRTHRRKISDHKLLQSFPRLAKRHNTKGKEPMVASEIHTQETEEPKPLAESGRSMTPREVPVLTRMVEAQARFETGQAFDEPEQPTETKSKIKRSDSSPEDLLSQRLKEIFNFDRPEKVLAEYPCWLLQSLLLQGYMYITEKHICFYSYLPKKSNAVAKSGYLTKRGRQNPKYNRYWFTLKEDVLSYYLDPSKLYFPSGHVDLRYGISASLAESKSNSKDVKDFTVTTDQRTYYFRADSATSAKEWVKILQKVIFRSHNEGDSVKISLPIENVIDIEDNPVIDFATTFKIRVIESSETYAIDEYFFSFFNFGNDVRNVLQSLIEDTAAQRASDSLAPAAIQSAPGSPKMPPRTTESPRIHESVKATLVPHSPRSAPHSPRRSGEYSRSSHDFGRRPGEASPREEGQGIFDRQQRSGSASRFSNNGNDKFSGVEPSSSDSFVHSIEQVTDYSAMLQSTTDTMDSASQILNRSDVFQSPTIHRLCQDPSESGPDSRRRSEDTARSVPTGAHIQVQPPSRNPTQEFKKPWPADLENGSDDVSSQVKAYSASSPTLQELVKAGAYPLQRAAGFAGYLKNRSKQMSNLLATESMGYLEKVSGMWAGGKRHYGESEGVIHGDQMVDPEDEEDGVGHGDRFRAHFALPPTEKLQATYFAYLHRVLPLYGKIYISNRKFCFRSLLPGTRTKLILPLKDVENVEKEKGFRFGYHGLVIVIKGHEELFFEFRTCDARDDCAITLHQSLESVKFLVESGLLAQQDKEEAEAAKAENEMLQEARGNDVHELGQGSGSNAADSQTATPVYFDDPRASIINFKPTESLRITCLTIGSRGDVQPYIALCKGLLAEGHRPRIATHAEFGPWVQKHGIDFAPVEGDPGELLRLCVENGMFTYSFLKEASSKFRGWIDGLLSSAWVACQDSDILIESPSAMAGIHIAEALRIPYFRAFTMPWTRTRAYPHAFAVPERKMGGAYNYITYIMFDNVFWKAIAGQVNRWRKKELGLGDTNLDKMQPNKVPFLYNFSPTVVVPPLDYSDWIRVTGYWFLDEATIWTPPKELGDFINRARKDGKKLVYIGFGSIVVSDPAALTQTVVDSVLKADVRCILSKGWSDRLGDPSSSKTEIPLPPEIHQIQSAPHDWLFSQMDAAAHHGGAGTTGASLRAGIPTIIKPFFGDQFFFGNRVEDLGVGICMKKLNVSVFSRALWEATHSERMIVKARIVGEQIREENGVGNAIQAIYRDLEYAKTLVKQRSSVSSPPTRPISAGAADALEDDLAAIEETWTFVGDETDLDISRRIREREQDGALDADETEGPLSGGTKAIWAVKPVINA